MQKYHSIPHGGGIMKMYIKYNTDINPKDEVIEVSETDVIDISNDPDDTYYTVDTFKDYMTFMDNVVI